MVFNCRSLFNEAAYLAALRRLRSPIAIRDADSKQSKTKIYEKNHLLLRIWAVIGRYGPHLMIVMISVTPNNFWNGPGIFDFTNNCLHGMEPSNILLYVMVPNLQNWRKPKRSAKQQWRWKSAASTPHFYCSQNGSLIWSDRQITESSGAVWKLRWPSWAPCP